MAKTFIAIIFMVFSSGEPALALIIEKGKQYAAGTLMEDASWPVAYVIPQGWGGGKAGEVNELVVLSALDKSGYVIIAPGESTANEQLQTMSKPMQLVGTLFTPIRAPTVEKVNNSGGRAIQGEYTVTLGQNQLNGYIVTLVDNNGVTISYILIHNGSNVKKLQRAINSLVVSTTLSDPSFNPPAEKQKKLMQGQQSTSSRAYQPPQSAVPLRASSVWNEHLNGKRWYYVKCSTYGGCTKRKIWLCRDGTFWTSSASSFFSQGGAGSLSYNAQNPGNVGKWQVASTSAKDNAGFSIGTLLLKYFDGSNIQIKVSMPEDQEGTYFNGVYYGYRGDASGCLD